MGGQHTGAQLPQDRTNQVYVSVKALPAGDFWLPDTWVYQDAREASTPETVGLRVPDFAFLISHPTKGKAMFDLGIRKNNGEGHPPVTRQSAERLDTKCERDVADILQSEGIEPTEIDLIIYSHLHWDHVGDPAPFTSAEIILGADSVPLLQRAYPTDPTSPYMSLPPNRRVTYLNFKNQHTHLIVSPFGPFECAIDLYGDGSLYVVHAPGHLAGHVAAAARVGPDSFLLLAGDSCHGRGCYCPGERVTSNKVHEQWEVAKETVGRLARLDKEYPNAVVILAHEKEREEEMPLFPRELNVWALEEVEKRKKSVGTGEAVSAPAGLV